MNRKTEHILNMHAGSLPRPDDVRTMAEGARTASAQLWD